METVLSYAYFDVSVRKHCLSKKITAHVMSAVMRKLFDKWEFAGYPHGQYGCMCNFCGSCHTHEMCPTNKKIKVK